MHKGKILPHFYKKMQSFIVTPFFLVLYLFKRTYEV